MQIALIDYGAGNLTSVRKGFVAAGAELATPARPETLDGFAGIVVPGVGHFGATASIDESWRGTITRRVEAGVPLLGICLGMQWLFEGSEEAGHLRGLALLDGWCRRLTVERPLKVPHIGWNSLRMTCATSLLAGVDDGAYVYFTHSYAAPVTGACSASVSHGGAFAAAVERDNVAGVQFHPEKSGAAGIRILRNFVNLTRR
jgi:glutamine amidotransferase